MTAQATRDEHCGPDDFVGLVDRIEISRDTANYLLAILELFSRGHKLKGPAPERLVRIQRALGSCTGADSTDASRIGAVQPRVTGDDASSKVVSSLYPSQSEPRRVDTTTAAEMLTPITKNGVRDLCRSDRSNTLDSVKIGSRHWITVESIEQYKATRRPRKRAKG